MEISKLVSIPQGLGRVSISMATDEVVSPFSRRINVPPCRPAIFYSLYTVSTQLSNDISLRRVREGCSFWRFPSLTSEIALFSGVLWKLFTVLSPISSHRKTELGSSGAESQPRVPAADFEPGNNNEGLSLPKLQRSTTVELQTTVDSQTNDLESSGSNREAQALSSDPAADRSEALLQPRLLVEALRESSLMLLEGFAGLLTKVPGPPALKNAVGATLGVCAGGLLYAFPGHTFGALATLSVFAALGLEKNHHIRAQGIVGGMLCAAHFVAMDIPAAAVCTVLATARTVFQAMLPEDRIRARAVVAGLGFGAAATVCGLFTDLLPLTQLSNIPLWSTALGSLSGAFTQRYSWATRVCSLVGTAICIPYHLLESLSLAGLVINVVILPRIAHSIWRYDVAKKSEECAANSAPAVQRARATDGGDAAPPASMT